MRIHPTSPPRDATTRVRIEREADRLRAENFALTVLCLSLLADVEDLTDALHRARMESGW